MQLSFLRSEAISHDTNEDNTVHANNTRFTQNTSSQENSGLISEKSTLEETHVDTSGDIKREETGKLYIRNLPRTI